MLLTDRGLAPSRTKAQALVMAGQVRVAGELIRKVGDLVPVEDKIEIESGPKYVSRGGEKLEGALDDFGIDPQNLVCLDVGASTGGFTDCLLKRGASLVYAIDVGRGQLDFSLRKNSKVVSMEKTHVLSLSKATFPSPPRLVVMDLSFISLKSVIPHLRTLLEKDVVVVPMVKPQFEVGPKNLKKGVVRSEEVRDQAVRDVVAFAKNEGFLYLNQTAARIKGPKGNQEYFLHLKTV